MGPKKWLFYLGIAKHTNSLMIEFCGGKNSFLFKYEKQKEIPHEDVFKDDFLKIVPM